MAWIYLLAAGVFEVGFTTAMRYLDGLRWQPLLGFIICAGLSFMFLTMAIRTIPLGTAYAIWTGIGAAGTVIVGLIWYNEPAETARLVFLMLLIAAIIGLKLVSTH
jgi:quaternary ammonium compound-resistance protein SugE